MSFFSEKSTLFKKKDIEKEADVTLALSGSPQSNKLPSDTISNASESVLETPAKKPRENDEILRLQQTLSSTVPKQQLMNKWENDNERSTSLKQRLENSRQISSQRQPLELKFSIGK